MFFEAKLQYRLVKSEQNFGLDPKFIKHRFSVQRFFKVL